MESLDPRDGPAQVGLLVPIAHGTGSRYPAGCPGGAPWTRSGQLGGSVGL